MRKRSAMTMLLIGVAILVPIAVQASHQFNDVSGSHTFHDDIAWLSDSGVTRGCNPPANDEFCPDDAVTRGQMAAFLKRFHDRFLTTSDAETIGLGHAFRTQEHAPSSGNGVVDRLTLNLNVPEPGVLFVSASAELFADTADAFACGINPGGSPALALGDSWRTVDLTANFFETCATETALAVNPGRATVRLVISDANASTEVGAGSITAVLYTDKGLFSLLGAAPEGVEAREVPDVPKGS